jgi:holin-like protein
MIRGLTILCAYQVLGELLTVMLHLPVPGAVVGMALLLVTLVAVRSEPEKGAVNAAVFDDLQKASQGLLKHLSLLFIPAGVGLVAYADILQRELWAVLGVIVFSTLLTLACTALVMKMMLKR